VPFLCYLGNITASVLLLNVISSYMVHSQAFKDEEEAEVVSAVLSTDKFAIRREITGKPY